MSQKYEKLKTLLKELFQLDQPDLDFGLYRIMHAKAGEVTQFLDKDLLPQVKEAFSLYKTADKAELEKELAKAIEQAQGLGVDPETTQKVKDLRAKITNDVVDIGMLENEVYDHLYSFFRRYYSEGDFLAKRVYKPGVYAIPYEGEEIKLHWANEDQYYIKTSEYLRDYTFRLRPDDEQNPMRVHFQLVDAAEGEHGNVKEATGKERRFKLSKEAPVAVEDGELVFRFTYQPDLAKQKELNAATETAILGIGDTTMTEWLQILGRKHVRADGTETDITRLRAHLDRYTARNTFDYFIHKDLGGFLRRELDFHIKNEVMHLDDVENETAARVEQYLSKIKVIRKIAGKIINFLAQLEDFQKRLWLKQKFIVSSEYCITLDRVPEQFYQEIAGNAAQREEWVRLFAIDTIQDFSIPLSVAFLKVNNKLCVDTRFFDQEFKALIVSSIDDLDGQTNGILLHSDNFHALRLLNKRYHEKVKCVYIDPPYNTDVSAIPYKNDYRHSSFAALIHDRTELIWPMLTNDGVMFVSIDKHERSTVQFALDSVFGDHNKVEELIWVQNTNDSRAKTYSTNHEYVEVYAKTLKVIENSKKLFRETKPGFTEVMALVHQMNPEYPSIASVEKSLNDLYAQHKAEYRTEIESDGLDWEVEKRNDPWKGIYPYAYAEYRDAEGRFVPAEEARQRNAKIWVWREDNISLMAAESKQSPTIRDPNHPNFRFYAPLHPVTGKPCLVPKGGWKYTYLDNPEHPDRKSFDALNRDHRIEWGETEQKVPQLKRMLHEVETNVAKSVLVDYSDGEKQTAALFGRAGIFLAPKHTNFVKRFINQVSEKESVILDCFAGSGSTAHAVIESNRKDGGRRKYIVVEMNEYFDSILVPRILKASYSPDWRDGKPISRDGLSQCIKIIRLETYEDALNNLEIHRSKAQQSLLEVPDAQGPDMLREQYLLRYMLQVEASKSQSLMNMQAFNDPATYKLKVKRPGSDESREVNVDLLETFNWLIGFTVQHIAAPQSFTAAFERDSEKRLRLKSRLKQDVAGQWWFRKVEGVTPEGRRTLIIWRKLTGQPEQDNLVLNAWMTEKLKIRTKDFEFDLIYVNGDNNLENLKAPDDTWKVRLIEEDFHRLMFEMEGV